MSNISVGEFNRSSGTYFDKDGKQWNILDATIKQRKDANKRHIHTKLVRQQKARMR